MMKMKIFEIENFRVLYVYNQDRIYWKTNGYLLKGYIINQNKDLEHF